MLLDALSLLISKAAFIGLRLLVLLVFSLILSKEDFGAMSLAFLTADISKFIADWGVDTWSLRQFSNPVIEQARHQFLKIIRLRLISSVLAILIAYSSIMLIVQGLTWNEALIVSCLSGTSLWINVGVNWLQARQLLRNHAIVLFWGSMVCIVGLYGVYHVNGASVQFVGVLLAFEVTIVFYVFYQIFKTINPREAIADLDALSILKESTPIAVAIFLALLYGRVDTYFVSHYSLPTLLADYSFASRAVDPILLFAAALTSTLYARASMLYQSSAASCDVFKKYAFSKVRLVVFSSVAGCLIFALIAPKVISLYVPQYSSAISLLIILLAATAFRCINLALTAIIQATGGYRTMTKISIINAFTTLSFIAIAGGLLEAVGVALAVAFAECLNTVLQFFTLKKITRIKT